MAWHRTGDYYVDTKGGVDAPGNGTTSNPYATLQYCLTNESPGTIVFNGECNEVLSAAGTWTILADGYCIFDGTSTVGSAFSITNITLDGTNGGIEIFGYSSVFSVGVTDITIRRIFMRDSQMNLGPSSIKNTDIEECVLYNMTSVTSKRTATPLASCRRSTFMFCSTFMLGMVRHDNNVYYECSDVAFDGDSDFADNNCIYNDVVPFNLFHNTAGGPAGTPVPGSPFSSLAAYQAEPQTLLFNDNSVEVDPQFNDTDSAGYDCTLNPASPIINAGSDGKQIGRYSAAIMLNSQSAEVTGGTDNGNVTYDANGDIYPTDPALFAQFETTAINLTALQNPMEEIVGWLANDFAAGRAIDSDITDSNPKRVTVEFRYSIIDATDLVNNQTYKDFNWNDVVTLDASNRSNGNPAYVIGEATQQNGTFVQFRVSFDPGH